ncbi:TolC family protein [Salinimicrobium sp. MT39]|uniref:TolC family protein n=1 Tax=Salinimicrobium profundisediminis TaxID=2994553 RepID=A0A9X3CW91_9FLAO|nr:TolC family protein [Salinimicrobium profundisediminis]MCX2838077.1 TolC family protein [Salinimicrobium profundisediminis]
MDYKISFLTGLFFLYFGSIEAQTLEDYLLIAVENNPQVKAAYSEFEAALQEAPQVKSLPDPTLTVSAFGQMVETRLGPQEARFSIMQMFPWFGTLEARENVATLMAEAKFKAFLETRNEILLQVSSKYYELYELGQQLQYQQENLDILQNYKDLALSRVSAGSGALSDVLQADIMRNESITGLDVIRLRKDVLLAQFNALLDRERSEAVVVPNEVETLPENAIFDTLVDNNPQLEELENMAASARAREELAKKEGMPNVGLGLDYVIVGERRDMAVEDNGRDAIMPMLTVSLPIFRGKYKAERKQAAFLAESYEQRKEGLKNQLSAELEAAFFEVREAQAMLQLYRRQVESSEQVLNLLLSSYRNAASDFEEVLRVRQELLKYQLAVAGAEANYLTALARIDYLSGKTLDYDRQK